MEHKKYHRFWRHLVSAPFIWSMIIPLVILDIWAEMYHRICFPLFGLPYVKRKNYIRFDRYKLPYLSAWDKFNCFYCEYANGLIMYVQKIGGETEKYFCSIKHKKYKGFVQPPHHKDFMRYGDEKAYNKCK